MAWNDNLIPGSRTYEIAASAHPRVRVLAGPGTDKSFAMKRRVARILEVEQVLPQAILAVTFTRVAAEDLHRELVSLGVPGAEHLGGRTLHGLAMTILMRNHVLQTLGRRPRPLNNFELEPLLSDLSKAHGKKSVRKKLIKAYGAAWARLQTQEPGFTREPAEQAFVDELVGWLTIHEAMLLDEIVPHLYQYLISNPGAQEHFEFSHVLIDEYQDLNRAEQVVLQLLGTQGAICVIGDDDQSIYSFKHAHPDGIRQWHTLQATDVHSIDECRRCPTTVVKMANALIARNADRVGGRQLSERAENGAGSVAIHQFSTAEQEADARLGGDEFAVLLPMLIEPEDAHAAAIELVNAFNNPLKVSDYEILVRVSAGVSFGVDDSVDASALLMNADLALYKAKSDGRGICRVYEPQMSLQMIVRREVEQDLRQALNKNQFVIHYQPLLDLDRGIEIGFEALLRWNHPEKGMIAPSAFIPVAEASGMIVPIGTWVLEQSCLLATTWQENISIAVNVSPVQFKSGKLVDTVAGALAKSGLAANRLELEITESSLLEKSSETLDILESLKSLGVSISLDDFGTGYSGLGYLNIYPIDKIKIDRSFVRDIETNRKSEELVRAAVNIGHSLGLRTLAEGIETKEQLNILRALGCQQGQGFLFGRAIPAGEIADGLKLKGNLHSKRLTA